MELDYTAIGQRIRKLRSDKHWSQEDLREKVNISKTHMSHIETGTTKLSLPVLVNIANALDTTTDHVLRDSVHSTTPVFLQDIQDILSDCNNDEILAMINTMCLVKDTIRNITNNSECKK